MSSVIGRRYGRSIVVKSTMTHQSPSGTYNYVYTLACTCGHAYTLRDRSLGRAIEPCPACRKPQAPDPDSIYRHPLYRTWEQMHNRCNNPADSNYHSYGGRGIYVCAAWTGTAQPGHKKSATGFRQFLVDMGEKPGPKHTLERKDNDGPYSPENCCWATRKEQGANRATTVWVEFRGERRPFTHWLRQLGIDKSHAMRIRRECKLTYLQVLERLAP